MSSLIANKVKTNMYLVSLKLFIVRTILCSTVQTYTTYTIIMQQYLLIRCSYLLTTFFQATLVLYSLLTTIRYSAHNVFASSNTYSLELYSEEIQTTTATSTRLTELLLT